VEHLLGEHRNTRLPHRALAEVMHSVAQPAEVVQDLIGKQVMFHRVLGQFQGVMGSTGCSASGRTAAPVGCTSEEAYEISGPCIGRQVRAVDRARILTSASKTGSWTYS
jgi:hypothetical protein